MRGYQRDTARSPMTHHYKLPEERPFTRAERDSTTLLFGGLTAWHDRLLAAVAAPLGHKVLVIPTPTRADYETGREYGSPGMCSPAHFTAGALINCLRRLRDEQGVPLARIMSEYIYVSPSSGGPCRFGMYEAEYRRALAQAGFEGFRVFTFEQRKFDARTEASGVELSARVFLPVFTAIFLGDIFNDAASRIRPYEMVRGSMDAAFERILQRACAYVSARPAEPARIGLKARLLSRLIPILPPSHSALLFEYLMHDKTLFDMLRECAAVLEEEVRVDYTRAVPVCKITGEFWVQTTRGDGNYRMFDFIEGHGAEVHLESIAGWFSYLIAQARERVSDRRGLAAAKAKGVIAKARAHVMDGLDWIKLWAAYRLMTRQYERMRQAFAGAAHPLPDQYALQRIAEPFYTRKCTGGEGHLEVAKTIYYTQTGQAHCIIGLKPFGCLPSTQSDGVQAAVKAKHPHMLHVAIEVSGDGEANAKSRALMVLETARARCLEECAEAAARTGISIETARAYAARHPELRSPFLSLEHDGATVSRAALFLGLIAARLDAERSGVAQDSPYAAGREGAHGARNRA